uniref:Uncharacterized protein n=1 Tax=Caenorhabditis japonica TaxID=281687 RepID=A0A8R1IYA8_CAEJA
MKNALLHAIAPSIGIDPPPHIVSTTISPGRTSAKESMQKHMVDRIVVGPYAQMFRLKSDSRFRAIITVIWNRVFI